MGVTYSGLRRENAVLREEIQALKEQLKLQRSAAREKSAREKDKEKEAPSFWNPRAEPGTSCCAEPSDASSRAPRLSRADIISERRSSFGELPLHGLMRAQGITAGVLPLADAFDRFDGNGSGGIDVGELRGALQYLGVSCSPAQADVLLKQYDNYPDDTLDIKEFATIVRDVKLLLEFDSDGDGQLNMDELQPALESLGVSIENVQMEKIMRRFDVDNSGTIDLVELNSLIRTVQAFVKYDTDGSGTIDIDELRGALRRLGLRAGSLGAADVFRRYDADESGVIELHEFAVLAANPHPHLHPHPHPHPHPSPDTPTSQHSNTPTP